MTRACAAAWRPAVALALAGASVIVQSDDAATSVPSQLGIEDAFRPPPFIADVAFWYVAVSIMLPLVCRARGITAR